MTVQSITAAYSLRDPSLSTSARFLLVTLANYANQDMQCWPSQARLADETGLTPRYVVALFKVLEEKGYISRATRPNRKDGSRTSHLITLHIHSELSTPRPKIHSELSSGRGGVHSELSGKSIVNSVHLPSELSSPKPSLNQEKNLQAETALTLALVGCLAPAPQEKPTTSRAEMARQMRELASTIGSVPRAQALAKEA